MSEQVATFFNARIGTATYLFLVTNNSAFDIEIRKALQRSVPKFGMTIAEKGRISTIHDGSERRAHEELLHKAWPADMRDSLDVHNSPFLVVIDTDFETFDPQSHDWFIIWLFSLGQPKTAILKMFDRLARVIVKNDPLFEFLESMIENPDGFFRAGTIWSRQYSDGLAVPLRKGRPPIVREELLRMLDKSLVDMPCLDHGWRMRFANEAQKWLARQGQDFNPRSVYAALHRAKWFNRARQTLGARRP